LVVVLAGAMVTLVVLLVLVFLIKAH